MNYLCWYLRACIQRNRDKIGYWPLETPQQQTRGNRKWPRNDQRPQPYVRPSPICKRWNRGNCRQADCSFRHICLECHGNHREVDCPRTKENNLETSKTEELEATRPTNQLQSTLNVNSPHSHSNSISCDSYSLMMSYWSLCRQYMLIT